MKQQRGYSVIELVIGVLLILILVFVLVRLAPS
jgi:type II secretory pathway pseudopilin PulG